ncbi:hypothetical protein [Desulfoscipio gibsoniae]|uniref:XcyI restriction endonuclease n=1 Tax=Desulfoscipio gibsoniae DSM 7213 TaxID=767817 RepID=R4KL26_9FIRM|nr:hypothetical protein [Desulfoscipio gibsoniae]AGL03903.1 hypothetical protein Desgi_4677 [Desulfoscipio gibsoniae DSM 7213]
MKYPFEVSFPLIEANPDVYISAVFSCLESEFLVLPKGNGFIDYAVFERGYESLKRVTSGFQNIDPVSIIKAAFQNPMIIIVLRTMLGFTPPEWAYVTTQRTGIEVNQGFVRTLDRNIRMSPLTPLSSSLITKERVEALIETACQLLNSPVPEVGADKIHRLDKADTSAGPSAIRAMSGIGVPYAMLLYERFLGRPFAGHRDSVSELIGDSLESAIEEILANAGVSYRKTKRAERIAGFDQAPDFIIPSEFNPQVVIEAKITEDDGTARDKVTRIQHLASISLTGDTKSMPKFEVIACIGGRGFGVRREDMKKLLFATKGKVFTLKTLDSLVEFTHLKEYKTK